MRSAPPVSGLATVAEARAILLQLLEQLPVEKVGLEHAVGRVLAEDVIARDDLPGIDNSAMDGYAVLSADLAGATSLAPTTLPLGLESRAGYPPPQHRAGTATAIATGAPLPHLADAVVAVEDTERALDGVVFAAAVAAGRHVRRRGEDVSARSTVLRSGRRLRSVDVGMCAAAGRNSVSVHRQPRVALLSGGDELVSPGTVPQPHQVTDVNSAMLCAAVREAGGVPVVIGPVRDLRASVAGALVRAQAGADLVVSSAGVSVGEHDEVRACVAEMGTVVLSGVAMRPGRPLLIGRVGDTPLLGLPGNPVSSAVTFLLFARAAILAMQGAERLLPREIPVLLGEAFSKPAHLETYIRVTLERRSDRLVATSSGGQGSAMMHGLASADALLQLAAGESAFPAGAVVAAMEIP